MAAALGLVAWWSRTFRRVEVVGDSMRPTLEPGDRLLLRRAKPIRPGDTGRIRPGDTGRIRPGDIVALDDPRRPARLVIKRVAACDGPAVTVVGDNPSASTDSRAFGSVERAALRGRAVYRYFPAGRRTRFQR